MSNAANNLKKLEAEAFPLVRKVVPPKHEFQGYTEDGFAVFKGPVTGW